MTNEQINTQLNQQDFQAAATKVSVISMTTNVILTVAKFAAGVRNIFIVANFVFVYDKLHATIFECNIFLVPKDIERIAVRPAVRRFKTFRKFAFVKFNVNRL